jgi:hypothetical protein
MNIVQVVYEWVFEPLLSAPTYDMNPINLLLKMLHWWKGEDHAAAESVEPGTL